jgi:hypothetical protein
MAASALTQVQALALARVQAAQAAHSAMALLPKIARDILNPFFDPNATSIKLLLVYSPAYNCYYFNIKNVYDAIFRANGKCLLKLLYELNQDFLTIISETDAKYKHWFNRLIVPLQTNVYPSLSFESYVNRGAAIISFKDAYIIYHINDNKFAIFKTQCTNNNNSSFHIMSSLLYEKLCSEPAYADICELYFTDAMTDDIVTIEKEDSQNMNIRSTIDYRSLTNPYFKKYPVSKLELITPR